MRAVRQALAYLERRGCIVWWARMNTGRGRLVHRDRNPSQWITFGFPGCPDILGQLYDGRLLAIEVKRPSGRLSPEQRAFLERAQRGGACAFVARSVDDVLRHIPLHPAINRNHRRCTHGC